MNLIETLNKIKELITEYADKESYDELCVTRDWASNGSYEDFYTTTGLDEEKAQRALELIQELINVYSK